MSCALMEQCRRNVAGSTASSGRNLLLLILFFLVAGVLAACVTVPASLPPQQVRSFKLTATHVTVMPGATVHWAEGLHEWAKARNIPDHELAQSADSDEARAFQRTLLANRTKEVVMRVVAPELAGTRPVRLNIVITGFVIASAPQRIIIGGQHVMSAKITLVDARSGAMLIEYPDFVAVSAAGQGMIGVLADAALAPDPSTRLFEEFSRRYRDWLLPK
jgi:hypothetical protein